MRHTLVTTINASKFGARALCVWGGRCMARGSAVHQVLQCTFRYTRVVPATTTAAVYDYCRLLRRCVCISYIGIHGIVYTVYYRYDPYIKFRFLSSRQWSENSSWACEYASSAEIRTKRVRRQNTRHFTARYRVSETVIVYK